VPRRTLIERARRGDTDALGSLWRAYQPGLLRWLRAHEPAVADDLASETWIGVARGLTAFEGDEAHFAAWLFTIARRRLADHRRTAVRRPPPLLGLPLADRPALDDAEASALTAIATEEAVALLTRLTPEQADVITLRVLAGLDVAQVAEIIGRSAGAVRVLQHRGLRRLAELLRSPHQAEVEEDA
jgi:RNA polymerase sigma-70 factor, ECF subfamily